jgi:hypothetical protein
MGNPFSDDVFVGRLVVALAGTGGDEYVNDVKDGDDSGIVATDGVDDDNESDDETGVFPILYTCETRLDLPIMAALVFHDILQITESDHKTCSQNKTT